MSNLVEQIQIEISDLDPCQKELKYTISADTVKSETDKVAKQFSSQVELPGFRKGKVPTTLVKNKFKDKINDELLQRFFTTAFEKTQSEEKLDIVTYTMDEEQEPVIKQGADFVFSIKYDIAPTFELPEYKNLELKKETLEIDDTVIDEQLKYYKEVYAEYKTVDGPAQAGDTLKVSYTSDFEVTEDMPVTVENLLESEENWIWLHDPEVIPGANEALIGAEAGKEYKLTSNFPEDYKEKALAGKTVNYTINVIEVQRRTPVTTDEELCEKMNIETIETLKEQLKTSVIAESEQKAEAELKNSAIEQILEKTAEFPLPPTTFKSEVNKQLQLLAQSIKTEEEAEEFKAKKEEKTKEAEAKAKDRLRRFFVIRSIAKAEDIVVKQEELNEHLQLLSRHYNYPVDQIVKLLEQNGGMNDIQVDLLISKVSDYIVEQANVS